MNNVELTHWQAIQAAMLYRFASTEFLKELHRAVSDLLDGVVDPLLELAKIQGRDAVLVSDRWGTRDTSQNWSSSAWPFLKDLQKYTAKDIAERAFGRYHRTAVNECLRGAEQFSMDWTTPEEEERYKAAVSVINYYGSRIDSTLNPATRSDWNDFRLMAAYPAFLNETKAISGFRVRKDIVGTSGNLPPKTGVYISADDPNMSLQFAWGGSNACPLRDGETFNTVGLEALEAVGRESLWIDHEKMFAFAIRPAIAKLIPKWRMETILEAHHTASSSVGTISFQSVPSTWYFVEPVPAESHSAALCWTDATPHATGERVLGGERCRVPGYYHSPAKKDSRQYFEAGAIMPEYASSYGTTIWQRDAQQD